MAFHYCSVPGCPELLITGRRCRLHAVDAEQSRRNWNVRRWYRTPRWKSLRATVLREAAYQCAECRQVVAELDVDHVTKHGGLAPAFWNRENLQALCKACHSRKTQRGE